MNNNDIIKKCAEFVKSKLDRTPDVAVVLGSGLGSLMDSVANKTEIDYAQIPGFPKTSVFGHAGKMIAGEIEGKYVIAMKGRFHYYEGHEMEIVTLPIRMFYEIGVRNIILTNAAGGVNTSFKPGDLMLINDHIGFACPSPLRGPNLDEYGTRFPDMSKVYSKRLADIAEKVAAAQSLDLKKGVYFFCKGPQFETPAEIRAARALGADAVGMSTVPEAVVAKHMQMDILAISTITNMASGVLDQPLNHQEVLETGKLVEKKFSELIKQIIIEI